MERYRDFPMSFESHQPGVLEVIFDAPNLNAVNDELHNKLPRLWKLIDDDPDTRVVIVRGAGKAFSAGGSFELVDEQIKDYQARKRVLREARDLYYAILDCSKPIISAIHGPAVGAGLVVGMMADISIATRDAKIIDGHTRLGVAAGDHAAAIWPMLCGMAKAKYYLMTCEPISGEEAERIGLVSKCVDESELVGTARDIAARLGGVSGEAVQFTKHALNNWYRQFSPIFEASMGYEFFGFGGPDVIEGLASHKERRAPKFES